MFTNFENEDQQRIHCDSEGAPEGGRPAKQPQFSAIAKGVWTQTFTICGASLRFHRKWLLSRLAQLPFNASTAEGGHALRTQIQKAQPQKGSLRA
ncbi:hypothetical protein [uncultured Sulfitobacter sp.]|uniref:hypothetical protein n=1 Tax=uncultured Sulfitobacter sp. TaxID=191468 RepID=UPI00263589E8|nr:hypothetical protein [uncultured Sulfitobacter sp.]